MWGRFNHRLNIGHKTCLGKHDFETGNYEGDLTTYCFCAAEASMLVGTDIIWTWKGFLFFWVTPCILPLSRWGHCCFSVKYSHVFLFLSLFFCLDTTLRWGWRWLIQLYFSFKNKKEKRNESKKMQGAQICLCSQTWVKIQFQIKHGFLSMPNNLLTAILIMDATNITFKAWKCYFLLVLFLWAIK